MLFFLWTTFLFKIVGINIIITGGFISSGISLSCWQHVAYFFKIVLQKFAVRLFSVLLFLHFLLISLQISTAPWFYFFVRFLCLKQWYCSEKLIYIALYTRCKHFCFKKVVKNKYIIYLPSNFVATHCDSPNHFMFAFSGMDPLFLF